MKLIRLLGAALIFFVVSGAHVGAQVDVKLIPGTPVEFEVADAPASMAIQLRHSDESVRMTIKLPADYDSEKPYPVLLFLNGGDGGMGGELNMADPFLGGEGYILCNMPLFKRVVETDKDEVKWSITPADAPYALDAYRVLFAELHRLVPNADKSKSVLAGFSNGANSAALFLWASAPEFLNDFSAFILIEGGFWLGSDRDSESGVHFQRATFSGLENKRVLVMYGDQTTPPDRIPWIAAAKESVAAMKAAGVNATELPMIGISHDFQPDAMSAVRDWLSAGW
ncbi:MAG: hypothetical protein M5U15_04660 [Kiritimatiellae bacterium]|nr:hypothetical protein [Kiritimatiellia bacterium]